MISQFPLALVPYQCLCEWVCMLFLSYYLSATQLLGYILELASARGDIKLASLHVWEANTEARQFYEKRGFQFVSRLENHYLNIDPPNAVYMQCHLPWALKGSVTLSMSDFDATKHNLSQFK